MDRLLCLSLVILSAGCNRGESGYPVDIVVPSGFSGPIWIVKDAHTGEAIPLVQGKYRVTIPKNGLLKVKSLDPFTKWHTETAHYADGRTLPIDGPDKLPENIIALRDGGLVGATRNGQEIRFLAYYVGTRNEGKKFLETPSDPPVSDNHREEKGRPDGKR